REMLDIIRNNPELDCVCAFQGERSEGKLLTAMKSLFYKIMNKLVETEFKNGASDFRLFNSKVKEAVLSLGEYHRFSKGIFSWVGFNVHYMEYKADERNDGESKWSVGKLFKYALMGIVAFSTAPLQLATYIGSFATVLSVIYLIITLIRKFTSNINVDGFTQLVILITFFSGMLLFTVGIIGEYIAKIYQQVKNRPIYIAKDILERNNEE
ncbi:MAG: glycosyltransferase, partial [Eubacterium sp.]|nr:glycosyltransferase [Eubacterium sp.]